MELPDPLICLTLQNAIDDRDLIESLLSDAKIAPTVEKCIPLALRDVFQGYNTKLPTVPIPDAKTTLDYLTVLWGDSDDIHMTLVNAAAKDLLYVMPYLIARRANPNVKGSEPLALASRNGNIEMVKYLLAMKANVHGGSDLPIRTAVEAGQIEATRVLIDARADVNVITVDISSMKPRIADVLYSAGLPIDVTDPDIKLMIINNNVPMLRWLISKKLVFPVPMTLHYAIARNMVDVANFLYDEGVRSNVTAHDVSLLAQRRHNDMIRWLASKKIINPKLLPYEVVGFNIEKILNPPQEDISGWRRSMRWGDTVGC